jgi:hypothetical protein
MRRLGWGCGLLATFLLVGCGPGTLKPKGRVLKDGAPLAVQEEDHVNIFFVPVVAEGEKHPGDVFAARYNAADGSFQVTGKDGKGLPPGKYKITVEHLRRKKDLLHGTFGVDKTPFVRDVDGRAGEIVLDLDRPSS